MIIMAMIRNLLQDKEIFAIVFKNKE